MNYLPIFPRRVTWLLCGGVLGLCLMLANVGPVGAAEKSAPTLASPPLAEWYHELGRRDRVVQICVLTGALALFVIMKKLTR